MAQTTLPVLSRSNFPQVFEDAVSFEVRRVSKAVDQRLAHSGLGRCAFEDEHCDCRDLAVVHHLLTEQEFCLRHFQAVSRG